MGCSPGGSARPSVICPHSSSDSQTSRGWLYPPPLAVSLVFSGPHCPLSPASIRTSILPTLGSSRACVECIGSADQCFLNQPEPELRVHDPPTRCCHCRSLHRAAGPTASGPCLLVRKWSRPTCAAAPLRLKEGTPTVWAQPSCGMGFLQRTPCAGLRCTLGVCFVLKAS